MKPQMEKILDYLSEAEGTEFHRLEKESDITSPYGIYKSKHPNAEVFVYLSKLTLSLNVPRDTKEWTQKHLDDVNSFIATSPMVQNIIKEMVASFYEVFYKNVNIGLFPVETVIAMLSMYTTSPKRANMSVQRAINECIKNKFIDTELLLDDGDFGKKTKAAMSLILEAREKNGIFFGYMFEDKMLRHMTMLYDDLAYNNQKRYGFARDGWRNRMNRLGEKK